MHSKCLVDENIDISQVSGKNVSFGFLLHLPFRLRLGDTFRVQVNVENTEFDIWFKNVISIPYEESLADIMLEHETSSKLFTDVFALVKQPSVSDENIEKLHDSYLHDEEHKQYPSASEYIFKTMEALNHFLVAYSTGTNLLYGGAPLRIFRADDFIVLIDCEITFIKEETETITEDVVNNMFKIQQDLQPSLVTQFTGKFGDLDSETLSKISKSLVLHRDFLFYEHAFEAKCKMMAGDCVGALLMAVAALEGAHAAFLSDVFTEKLPGGSNDTNRQVIADYLRLLGISSCNKLTPYLFMEKEKQPEVKTIYMAGKGITYRNEIMHELRNKSSYKHRLRTNQDICEAYSAVLKVYECYRMEVEKCSEE